MNEIQKLITMLALSEIPFQVINRRNFDIDMGIQVLYPSAENRICDVVCFGYSYGGKQGLLEIMGLVDEEAVGDTVEGYLDAKECFRRIAKHWYTEGDGKEKG